MSSRFNHMGTPFFCKRFFLSSLPEEPDWPCRESLPAGHFFLERLIWPRQKRSWKSSLLKAQSIISGLLASLRAIFLKKLVRFANNSFTSWPRLRLPSIFLKRGLLSLRRRRWREGWQGF